MRIRYISVVAGANLLAVLGLIITFEMRAYHGIAMQTIQLCLWSALAFALSKTVLTKRATANRTILSFRELVVIVSIVFATSLSNVAVQATQKKIFGHVYTASYSDPEPTTTPGTAIAPTHPSTTETVIEAFLSVSVEEVSSRWITLGALLMAMSSGWAIVISSLIFSLHHVVYPLLGGIPEIGLFSLLPTFAIGVGSGIAFVRSGLASAIFVHFAVNLIGVFADNHTYIADTVIFGSAAVALFVLPLTLWFTRKRERNLDLKNV